jgi:hypothetical protein
MERVVPTLPNPSPERNLYSTDIIIGQIKAIKKQIIRGRRFLIFILGKFI